MSHRIFLSYRRADTEGFAHAIYNLLVPAFGSENLFMDVDTIQPGQDFVETLDQAVSNCDVMLVLIGPKWLNITDENGRRRLDDPEDFVRIEIKSAIEQKKVIIPVLLQGAKMPCEEELPTGLSSLHRRQAFRVGQHVAGDVNELAQAIKGTVQNAAPGEKEFRQKTGNLDDKRSDPKVSTARIKEGKNLPWIYWFILFWVTVSITAVLLVYLSNLLWNFDRGYLFFGGFRFIGLEAVNSMSIFLLLWEGVVSCIQWILLIRLHFPREKWWILINSLSGLLSGAVVDLIGRSNANLYLTCLAIVVLIWIITNSLFGPAILNQMTRMKSARQGSG
jgi:hypothetical protein